MIRGDGIRKGGIVLVKQKLKNYQISLDLLDEPHIKRTNEEQKRMNVFGRTMKIVCVR